ncbi:MAG TPA: phage terminase large subunit [Bacteroidia bacterium]|nr:phage terminase large subunit [Bacteroidia bacterium]
MKGNVFKFPSQLSVPAVLNVLKSDKRIILLYGWRDGGKSTSLGNILISKLLFDDHFRWIHIRKHYNEIASSTFQNLTDRVNGLGVNDYISITKDHFKFTNKLRPSNFIFGAGVDNPDKIRSTQDLNGVWFEEFHDANSQDFESIYGTIRTKKGFNTKFIGTLNNDKIPYDGFIHNTFFKESSPIKNDVELIHVSWRDNQFIDKAETEKKLKLVVLNNEERFSILDSGGIVPENVGEYYTEFGDFAIHDNLIINNNYPLLVSFDFNYEPTTCVIAQNINERGGGFNFYKEIQKDGGTRVLVHELKKYLNQIGWNNKIEITGDASGHKHDTKSGAVTDFNIIQSELSIPTSWINYNNKMNMSLGVSRDIFNYAFFKDIIRLDRNGCKGLINDFRIAKPKPGTSEFIKDRNTFKLDLLDAGRYAFHKYFSEIKQVELYSEFVKNNK